MRLPCPVTSVLLQRKCACGNYTLRVGNVRRKKTNLQRKANSQSESPEIPPIVHEVLNSPEHPLDSGTGAFMESRFGHDFSQVRVHTDANAAESARGVNALAYTVGWDVVFGKGQYAPRTADGQKLMAHELAHVAQPKEGGSRSLSQPGDPGEREADLAADAVATGETMRVGAAPGAAMQRQPLPGSKSAAVGDSLIENASPFLAAALGSATLDRFDTGKSDIKADHKTQLASVAYSPPPQKPAHSGRSALREFPKDHLWLPLSFRPLAVITESIPPRSQPWMTRQSYTCGAASCLLQIVSLCYKSMSSAKASSWIRSSLTR